MRIREDQFSVSDIQSMVKDIDQLREFAVAEPYYHGLGSIRLRLNKKEIINFYSKKHIPAISKYIHTHQEELHCDRIYGEYKNIVYDWEVSEEESDWCMEKIQCVKGTEPELIHPNVLVNVKSTETLHDNIVHSQTALHDLELMTDNVVTKMRYGSKKFMQKATIIRNKRHKYVCGFSQQKNPDENWQIIREIVNEL